MLLALVTESSATKQRSASVAMVYAAMPLGGAGVSLLIMLIASSHWRTIFVVGGVLPLVLAPLMAIALPESVAFQRVQQASATLRAGSVVALFADGRARRTLLLWASFLLELLLLYLLLNWLPTLLVSDGFTRVEAAGAQIGFNLGGVLSAVLIGYLLGEPPETSRRRSSYLCYCRCCSCCWPSHHRTSSLLRWRYSYWAVRCSPRKLFFTPWRLSSIPPAFAVSGWARRWPLGELDPLLGRSSAACSRPRVMVRHSCSWTFYRS